MKQLHINSVQPGDKIAKPILLPNGNVLVGTGLVLTDRYIERLKRLGHQMVYVEDAASEDIMPEDVIRDETRRRALQEVYTSMTGLMDKPNVKSRFVSPDLGKTYKKIFGTILSDLKMRRDVLVNLANLFSVDGYLYHHSVNVAVLAGIIGMAKGYNEQELMDLGVGALLFDVGMTKVPKELFEKKGPLTAEEFELVKKHPQFGFELLRKDFDLSLVSAHCAYQHHERFNGSGYPRGLKRKQIHEYAQIVGIADVYDALVSPRYHRQCFTPNEAVEYLFGSGNEQFDINLIRTFVKHIAIYPVASTVQLNTGQIGIVSRVHPNAVHRPVIRITHDAPNQPVKSPYEIDLKTKLNLVITQTL